MAKIIILGSSNAIADEDHENAHMIIIGKTRTVLVDSPHNPIFCLKGVGVDFNETTDFVLTHFHPDHASGIPLLLMDMWLRGRKNALNIYGLPHALDRLENLMNAFAWGKWPDFFPVTFVRLPSEGINPVLSCLDFDICASEVCHVIPTLGRCVSNSRIVVKWPHILVIQNPVMQLFTSLREQIFSFTRQQVNLSDTPPLNKQLRSPQKRMLKSFISFITQQVSFGKRIFSKMRAVFLTGKLSLLKI